MLKKSIALLIMTLGAHVQASNGPIFINGQNGQTLENLNISNPNGDCITIRNSSNITIKNSTIGPCGGVGVYINGSDKITVEGSEMEKVAGGVYAVKSSSISVKRNHFLNVTRGSTSRGQFVQFNQVTGKNNKINHNIGENIVGSSDPEDLVSIFRSHGTADSPIEVIGNHFRGGGPSVSGGGIMTGDFGGSHILVKDNIVVNPGQYGIAIAGGENIKLINNKVFSERRNYTNVGIYVAKWRGAKSCKGHTVTGNSVTWTDRHGLPNSAFNSRKCGKVEGWEKNNWNAGLSADILPKNLFDTENLLDLNSNNNVVIAASESDNDNMSKVSSPSEIVTRKVTYKRDNVTHFAGQKPLKVNYSDAKRVNEFTASFRIKPDEISNTFGVLRSQGGNGWSSGWRIVINKGNVIFRVATVSRGESLNCGGIKRNEWSFYTFSYDGAEMKCFRNGELVTSKEQESPVYYANSSSPMLIGASDGTANFKGYIDDLIFEKGVPESVITNDKGLVTRLHMPFHNARDASVYGNRIFKHGRQPVYRSTAGGIGRVAHFYGGNRLKVNYSERNKLDDFSLSFWVKPKKQNGTIGIVRSQGADGWSSGWRVVMNRNQMMFRVVTEEGRRTLSCGLVRVNEWAFYSVSYDGSEMKCFVNGQLASSEYLNGKVYFDDEKTPMLIGTSDGTKGFKGRIDDLKYYEGTSDKFFLTEYQKFESFFK